MPLMPLTAPTRPLAWVVPGPLRQMTGGYLYDARMVDGLRASGRPVGVLDVRATRWPLDGPSGRRLVQGLRAHTGPSGWGAVVVDELAHPPLVAAILAGRLRRALTGAPLVLLVHHLRCSEPAPWPLRLLSIAAESVAVRAADLVVCTSETTARTVRPLARCGVPVAVVRPGWDTLRPSMTFSKPDSVPPGPLSRDDPSPPSPLSRKRERGSTEMPASFEKGQARGVLQLLLVGHWTPRKGILQALAALRRTPMGVTLDLVGEQDRDPAYAARVRAALCDPAIRGRARAHGRVADAELAALYRDADALLLPSSHEGYGMVLAEALAAGLPIIATCVGAVPEVVRDGLEADLVAPGDVTALAQAIRRLADNPADRAVRSRLALERAASLPTWDASIAQFGGLLDDIAAKSERRQP